MKKSSFFKKANANKIVFYFATLAFPVIHFLIFYIAVNFNSIMYAFSFYDYSQVGSVTQKFVWFDNFVHIFEMFQYQPEMLIRTKNSIIGFCVTFLISSPLGIIFSYYIFKKRWGSKLMKILLFLPQILSAMVLAVMVKYFVNKALPYAWETFFGIKIKGLLPMDTVYPSIMPTMIVFTVFNALGSSMLMYVGTMSNISESVIEQAQIDGVTPFKEFTLIVFPCIYSTFVTFTVVEVASLFTLQLHMFSVFGKDTEIEYQTIGFYLYNAARQAKSIGEYPELSAFGLLCTALAVPMTFLTKKGLERIGKRWE